jgi:spore maturation protein A
MMKFVICGLMVVAFIFSAATGRMSDLQNAVISESAAAVTLALTLAGVICLWSGVMRVAQKAGLVDILARAFTPVLSLIFTGINPKGRAMGYIVLNLTANLLGLGNAATPFGIAAMKELETEEQTDGKASNNMVLFVILNTASLQIIPTTMAALRLKHGSSSPMDVLPAIWLTSLCTVVITVTAAKLLGGRQKIKNK